ncbi:MAG: peptidoglycan DD-metalloendopeptidase family protein [Bacteroidaceae bacterium]|nr:peptidoglycan DD-metalloendopeptidase family protein [Bacteroidaceae bacterium]
MSQKPHISFLIKVFLFFVAFNVSYIAVQPVVAQKAKTTRAKVATKTTTSKTKNKKAAKPVDKKTLLKNEQAATQRKRQQSQQQIQVINRNIKANLDSVLIIDHRISKQISSIDSLDRQIRQLNANIDTLNSQIKQIKKELLDKKKKYANAMIYMQKHKSVQEKLMFIFSADNLAQIIRRMRYIREYSAYLKAQGEMIKLKQKEMEQKQEELVASKAQMEANIAEMKRKRASLETMKNNCEKKVQYLNQNLGVVQNQIKQYQQKEADLNAQIDRIIQQEIAEAKRRAAEEARRKAAEEQRKKEEAKRRAEEAKRKAEEARRKAEEARKAKEAAEAAAKAAASEEEKRLAKERAAQAASEAKVAEKDVKTAEKEVKTAEKAERAEAKANAKAAATTPVSSWKVNEDTDAKLSTGFANNKGRLPMPITGSYSVIGHYGTYNVSGLKNVTLDNKGIDIRGQQGAMARSVFDGEVSSVFQYGATYIVMVRHGSYISVYSGLSSVVVSKGMKVGTRQTLGKVGSDAEGRITLHFQLRKESARLNPEQWVR